MRTFSVRKGMALSACAVLAVSLGAATQAQGSTYTHPSPVLTNPANYTPNLVDTGDRKPVAYAAAEAGTQMVVVGRLQLQVENSTRTTQYDRTNMFAFETAAPNQGAVDRPTSHLTCRAAKSGPCSSNGDSVYIGGGFTTVNGPRTRVPIIAKLSLSTGALDTTFNPSYKGGKITDMAMYKGHAGDLRRLHAKARRRDTEHGQAAALHVERDHGTAAQQQLAPGVQVGRHQPGRAAPGGGGHFLQVDGVDRPRMFMLNLGATSATLSSWNYPPNGVSCSSCRVNAQAYIQDVDFAPDSSWFAVAAFGFQFQSNYFGRSSATR